MTNLRRPIVLAIVAAAAVTAAAQSPPTCAELGTAMRNVSSNRIGDSTSIYNCSFDRQMVTQKCSVTTTLATGQKLQQYTTQIWGSVADLVDQYKINPPLNYSLKLLTAGEGALRETTYTYDDRRRVVREDNVSAAAKMTLTWSEWDANGRPTKGKWTGEPAPSVDTDTVTYDDAGRKMHRVTTGAGGVTSDIEFDAAGM